jgi:cob(I)alamin adenosyltransferase
MPDTPWTRQELLDQIATAIAETRAHSETASLTRILIELEDVAARLSAGEPLTDEYRQTLFFDVIATRELDDSADTHMHYLNRLSEIAAAINEIDPP